MVEIVPNRKAAIAIRMQINGRCAAGGHMVLARLTNSMR
jgi:hypothetical protein